MMKIQKAFFRAQMLLIALIGASTAWAEQPDSDRLLWIKEFEGKSTNEVVWDDRFQTLLSENVPKTRVNLGMTDNASPLVDSVNEVFSGAPEDVFVRDGRFVVLSASRHQSAMEKGFLWLDLKTGVVIGSVVHYYFGKLELENTDSAMLLIYSKQVGVESLPREFQKALEHWIATNNIRVESSRFVGRAGSVKRIRPAVSKDTRGSISP